MDYFCFYPSSVLKVVCQKAQNQTMKYSHLFMGLSCLQNEEPSVVLTNKAFVKKMHEI